jgi:branched-chain amino acid transport system substrate-binding protein
MKQYSPDTQPNLTGEVTPTTIAATLSAAKDIVLPAGHGTTFTCDATAIPGLKAACSAKEVTGTLSGTAPPAEARSAGP